MALLPSNLAAICSRSKPFAIISPLKDLPFPLMGMVGHRDLKHA
jgi:hypothetical protein